MDSWFVELFDIVMKQKETEKMDRLLPKVFNEFDVLVRSNNLEELWSIHDFIKSEQPVQTDDVIYNHIKLNECLKEITYRIVLLDDFSVLDQDMSEIINSGDGNKMEEYLGLWKDFRIIYDYLIAYMESDAELDGKETLPMEEEIPDNNGFEEFLEEEPETKPIPEEKQIPKPEPITEPVVIEPAPEIESDSQTESFEEPEPIEESKLTIETQESVEVEPVLEEEIKTPVDKPKPIPELSTPKEDPKPVPSPIPSNPKENFFLFFDELLKSYPTKIDKERLILMSDPIPTFIRLFLEHIDSEIRTPDYFLTLFTFFETKGYFELADFVIEHSKMLEKCLTVNIGLLHIEHVDQLRQIFDHVRVPMSKVQANAYYEILLYTYIDDFGIETPTTKAIHRLSEEITKNAPYQIETHEATGAIEFFLNHILLKPGTDFDSENQPQLYWSIILAAGLGIHVVRRNATDYQTLIDYISLAGTHLFHLSESKDIKEAIKAQCLTYVRAIHKTALSSVHYASWWTRQVDDLLDSKLNAVNHINDFEV